MNVFGCHLTQCRNRIALIGKAVSQMVGHVNFGSELGFPFGAHIMHVLFVDVFKVIFCWKLGQGVFEYVPRLAAIEHEFVRVCVPADQERRDLVDAADVSHQPSGDGAQNCVCFELHNPAFSVACEATRLDGLNFVNTLRPVDVRLRQRRIDRWAAVDDFLKPLNLARELCGYHRNDGARHLPNLLLRRIDGAKQCRRYRCNFLVFRQHGWGFLDLSRLGPCG